MILKKWEELPEMMRCPEVRKYYNILTKHKFEILCKRIFDVIVAFILLIILAFPMIVISIMIAMDSPGGVFYRQVRVTTYGREFRIHKFRTMVVNADKIGTQVTVGHDTRITKVGAFLRNYRFDEFPQLFDILNGSMSFVGTRPEVTKYVKRYKPEYMATLLLPAGVTSEASIMYKDEDRLLENADNVDDVYVRKVLPGKMKYNLESIRKFSFLREVGIMVKTVFAVFGKDYSENEQKNVGEVNVEK